jgi:flagellar hook-associated protein 1 FlgK
MPGLFGSLEIARRGLLAGQAGLQVTGQNIANANTPGYARKVIRQAAVQGARLAEGTVGAGVDVRRIEHVRDAFLDGRILEARAELGDARARAAFLREVEATLGDLEEGSLSETLAAFFDSWHDLALSPESLEVRQAVRDAGTRAASLLNRLSAALDGQARAVADALPAEVAELNSRIGRVAELSRRIVSAEAGGSPANELRDERQRIVEEIAETIDVNGAEAPNGRFLLRIGGVVVADGETAIGIALTRVENLTGEAGYALVAGGVATGARTGALAARLAAANETIPGYRARLDEIAEGLAEVVNAVHANAFALDGGAGGAFFEIGPAGSGGNGGGSGAAARIRVAGAVLDDPAAIAASLDGAPGDNAAARAIADAGSAARLRDGARSLGELVAELSEVVARDTGEASFLEEARGGFVASLENRRDAVSAVSLDEEAVNLVQYQDAYEAAARVLAVANEMIDTLLAEVR